MRNLPKMRHMSLGLLAAASTLALSTGASAADLPQRVYSPPPLPVAFSWTGFYIGGHIGGAWGTTEWDDPASTTGCAHSNPNEPDRGNSNPTCQVVIIPPGDGGGGGGGGGGDGGGGGGGAVGAPTQVNTSHSVNGFLGGGQVGYNHQVGSWVWGVEAQGSFADIEGQGACGVGLLFNCKAKTDGLATFAGRVGFAVDRALIYVKGGGAWAHDRFSVTNSGGAFTTCEGGEAGECLILGGNEKSDRWGWMLGTGVEYAVTNNWSAKIEYNYLNL